MSAKNLNYKKYEYPLNLLKDISEEIITPYAPIPDDLGPTIEYVLACMRKDPKYSRSVEIALMRYKERKSYAEIGHACEMHPSYANQLLHSLLGQLRRPSMLRFLCNGVNGVIQRESTAAYARGYTHGLHKSDQELCLPAEREIEDLKLPLGAENALRRNRILTTHDVYRLTRAELLRVRGLGAKYCEEIVFKMQQLGYDISQMGAD